MGSLSLLYQVEQRRLVNIKMANNPREGQNIVHYNAIWRETIKKELRNATLTLNTTFSINPYHKMHTVADKPNSNLSAERKAAEDPVFLKIIDHAALEPHKKYDCPMTEAQEVGWFHKPLVDSDRQDSRLHFPRHNSEITKYMNAAWRLKEQTENQQ